MLEIYALNGLISLRRILQQGVSNLFPVRIAQHVIGLPTPPLMHFVGQAVLQLPKDVVQKLALDLRRPRQAQHLYDSMQGHCSKEQRICQSGVV